MFINICLRGHWATIAITYRGTLERSQAEPSPQPSTHHDKEINLRKRTTAAAVFALASVTASPVVWRRTTAAAGGALCAARRNPEVEQGALCSTRVRASVAFISTHAAAHVHTREVHQQHARGTRHTAREEIWSPLPTLISLALARDARAHTIYARTIQYALTRHAHTHTHTCPVPVVGAAADTPSTRFGPRCDGGKRACTTRPQHQREGVSRHVDNKERRASSTQAGDDPKTEHGRASQTNNQTGPARQEERQRPPADSLNFFSSSSFVRENEYRQLVKHGGERSSVVLRFDARVRRTCNAR